LKQPFGKALCGFLAGWMLTGLSAAPFGARPFASVARAEPPRLQLAVVNLSGTHAPLAVVKSIERELLRLYPNSTLGTEPALRKLITTGERPLDAVIRLIADATDKRNTGRCAEAVALLDEAEELALRSVSLSDERAPLRRVYSARVVCEHTLGHAAARDTYARRLRALTAKPTPDLPDSLWNEFVATAVPEELPAEALVELQIDSEPANAQVQINFRAEGSTPRTLTVPPGEYLVEVQKEGYKKAYRRVVVEETTRRAVFRLVDKRLDRLDLTASTLRLLRASDPKQRPRSVASLAQWLRADRLALVRFEGDQLRIWQFDAERGAFLRDELVSTFDPVTGSVSTLQARATPNPQGLPGVRKPSEAATTGGDTKPLAAQETDTDPPPLTARRRRLPDKSPTPWWGWAIAAGIGAAVAYIAFGDRSSVSETLDIRATYEPSP